MVGNLGEIIWEGSQGNLVEVKPTAKYAALAVLNSPWALKHWTPVEIPASIKQWVKIKNLTVIDGKSYYAPGRSEMAEIGVVVGLGDTLDEAIGLCEERGAMVNGYAITCQTDSLRESGESVEEAKALGIPF